MYHVIHGVLRKAPRSSSLNITLPLHLCDLTGILPIHKHSQDLGTCYWACQFFMGFFQNMSKYKIYLIVKIIISCYITIIT